MPSLPSKRPARRAPAALPLVPLDGELRIDSRVLAGELQNQHQSVMELIDRYTDHFTRFGLLPFQTEAVKNEGARGAKHQRYALLNEDQSYFLLSLSRNTDHVVDLKANLVTAFGEARRAGAEVEYLPTYHALHDRVHTLAAESSNVQFVHMNFNKLINKTIGVQSGERHGLPVPRRSLMVVAQAAATHAMEAANDHHDGYQKAKQAMQVIAPVAQRLSGSPPLLK